ncbi:hypothetical protein JB92DRAFT_2862902 [Gautieria morchelliformis]|nr:hypothetical protein JB92DRAFT_2862902 [Gautieria morchelliformis]
MNMSSPHCDCAVQTSSSMTGLTALIDDATNVQAEEAEDIARCHSGMSVSVATPYEWTPGAQSHLNPQERTGKSSAAARHFAKYEPRQLEQISHEIELGWDCGICLETAEDPCVTRCGHLYCQSHLNHWLSTHPSCPVCKTHCTPAQDVVPIFSRGRASPLSSPISSSPRSPTPSDDVLRDCRAAPLASESRPRSPTRNDSIMSDYDIFHADEQPTPIPPLRLDSDSSHSHIQPAPHPLTVSYQVAHYLGIALRIVGIGIILSVLLR